MNYQLVVLTHGDSATLGPCLDSFMANVTPAPSSAFLFADGGNDVAYDTIAGRHDGFPWTLDSSPAGAPLGFCAAVRESWQEAVAPNKTLTGHTHVFWLEHDFLFERPVDLELLEVPLAARPNLAQMALMRNPVNDVELAAGGLYESRPDEYSHQRLVRVGKSVHDWLEHSSYFTTTPSLMRRAFMAENPWPEDGPPECEGRYGVDLVARGYRFGVWGSGEPWVQHVGERTGHGY